MRVLNQVSALRYVTAEKAPTYRAIIQVFFEARQHYVIELRPADVLERIHRDGLLTEVQSEHELDYYLGTLVDWGNLQPAHDSGSVSRLEDFYRKRLLYHLTPVGEAAHRAVVEVEATVGRSGSLQSTLLIKIRDALQGLTHQATGDSPEPRILVNLLRELHPAFESLTQEANRFIGELNKSSSTQRMEEDRFVLYREALVTYISRFIEHLRLLADEIRLGIEAVEQYGPRRLFEQASGAAECPPAAEGQDPTAQWLEEQLARWTGMRAWFLGEPATGVTPTVERLRDVAVASVVGLTRALGRLNDRRARPVDRAADFRVLAGWFARCHDEREAHALWHACFGLASARHFHLEEEDPELTSAATSWWDARPVQVPVRLRVRGNISTGGRPAAVPDHSSTREWIAQKRRREREQIETAMRRFAGRGPLQIRDLSGLDPSEFDQLLALLDRALSAPPSKDGSRSTRTSDGRLHVLLRPPLGDEMISLETPRGRLRCLDYTLEVRELLPRAPAGASSRKPGPSTPREGTS